MSSAFLDLRLSSMACWLAITKRKNYFGAFLPPALSGFVKLLSSNARRQTSICAFNYVLRAVLRPCHA